MAATTEGKLVYRIYRALSYSVSPVVKLHLQYRRLRGREHPQRWTERLGRPSLPRPPGPLLWFHAVSLVIEDFDVSEEELRSIEDLKLQLAHRQVWMASSIHRGEEEIMLGIHRVLTRMHPEMVTILVPRDPRHGVEIAQCRNCGKKGKV